MMTRLEKINHKIKYGHCIEFMNSDNVMRAVKKYNDAHHSSKFINDFRGTHKNMFFKNLNPPFNRIEVERYGCSLGEAMALARHFDFYYIQSGNVTMLLNKNYYPHNSALTLLESREYKGTLGHFSYAIIDKDFGIVPKEEIKKLLSTIGGRNDKT